jgi:hypothetical protein
MVERPLRGVYRSETPGSDPSVPYGIGIAGKQIPPIEQSVGPYVVADDARNVQTAFIQFGIRTAGSRNPPGNSPRARTRRA